MLTVEHIDAYYGESHILWDVSLDVKPGEVVCLLGRNGAGKSTTLKTVIGLVPPRTGTVRFKGELLNGLAPWAIAWLGVGYVPEDRRIFPHLTVQENLEVAVKPGPRGSAWTVPAVLELFPILRRLLRSEGRHLSGGEQQMLAIARTLLGNPELLLLDEPSEGLAPLIVQELARALRRLRGELAILLVEQNFAMAKFLADRSYVIDKGRVCFSGTPEELERDEHVRERYLALGAMS
jgi:branched-chain amino acid transport system ATP-binding protein